MLFSFLGVSTDTGYSNYSFALNHTENMWLSKIKSPYCFTWKELWNSWIANNSQSILLSHSCMQVVLIIYLNILRTEIIREWISQWIYNVIYYMCLIRINLFCLYIWSFIFWNKLSHTYSYSCTTQIKKKNSKGKEISPKKAKTFP